MDIKLQIKITPLTVIALTTVLIGATGCATPERSESKSARSLAGSNNKPTRTRCGSLTIQISRGDVECLTQELVELNFPELRNAWEQGRIKFKALQSNAYFFKTSYSSGYLSGDRSKRTYSIDVNDSIYDPDQKPAGAPTVEAIQGILAHELVHLVDYEKADIKRKIHLGVTIIIHPSSIERATDETAFARGFAQGIRKYREWIYGKLTQKVLKRKMKRYYTPEEIDRWIDQHTSN